MAWSWRWLVAAGCVALGPLARAAGPFEPFQVGVRSSVVAHSVPSGRTYVLLSPQLIASVRPLIKPVDESALMARLMQELDRHGFQLATLERKPNLLIALQYGRGWLPNPFYEYDALVPGGGISPPVSPGSLVGQDRQPKFDTHLFAEPAAGLSARAQAADTEKLCIQVAAWEYPVAASTKAKMLWQTTLVVDDPDHRDLNLTAGRMLAAGAPYFGEETKHPEVEITTLATGVVQVGTPEVVGSDANPAAVSVPASAAVAPAEEPTTNFNVPAGDALTSLQLFIQQSGERIIYPVEQLLHVRTKGVTGEFTAGAALGAMLEGSGLVAELDEKTGVFVVHRAR